MSSTLSISSGLGWLFESAPGGTRTHNLGLRSALLYPVELPGRTHAFGVLMEFLFLLGGVYPERSERTEHETSTASLHRPQPCV